MNLLEPPVLMLPVPATSVSVLDTFGLDAILGLVIEGVTLTRISEMLGVRPASLANWLTQHERREDYLEAKKRSAELLGDKAGTLLEELADREDLTGPMVGLAKLQVDHLKWMAGIRNSKYREKAPAEDVAAAPNAPSEIPRFYITIAPGLTATATPEPRVIEHEP